VISLEIFKDENNILEKKFSLYYEQNIVDIFNKYWSSVLTAVLTEKNELRFHLLSLNVLIS